MTMKYILIVGSADKDCDGSRLARATEFAKAVTEQVISVGCGVAVLATREPVREEEGITVPLAFDWEVLRTVEQYLENRYDKAGSRIVRVFMGADSMEKRFSTDNVRLFQSLQAKGALDVRHIEEDLYSGGTYGDWQADLCDGMIAIGGGGGTYQIADKMLTLGKPVMPMDIRIGSRHRDGEGAIQLLEEMKSDQKLFLPRSHQVVNTHLYALSIEQPFWSTSKVADAIAQILAFEMEETNGPSENRKGAIRDFLLKAVGKTPQIAQSSFHSSKSIETIGEIFSNNNPT